MARKTCSIEESVEQWAKEQLKGVKLYPKTDIINPQIEKGLKSSLSKSGKEGSNYPDIKCLLSTPNGKNPVMIEVNGTKDALIKRDNDSYLPYNLTKKGEPNYTNIAKYAVNGAVRYANAIVRNTTYKEVIAIGVNRYEESVSGTVYEVSVWYISRQNLFIPKEVALYSSLSFLLPKHQKNLLNKNATIGLSDEEIRQQKAKLASGLHKSLAKRHVLLANGVAIVFNQTC